MSRKGKQENLSIIVNGYQLGEDDCKSYLKFLAWCSCRDQIYEGWLKSSLADTLME